MQPKYLIILLLGAFLIFGESCQPKAEKEMGSPNMSAKTGQALMQELPEAVKTTINRFFAGAEINLVETEKINGTTLYDIEFKENRGEIEVAEDGTVIDITTVITWQELPAAVAATIKKILEESGANLVRLEKAEVQAEIKEEQGKKFIARILPPLFLYEAELARGDEKGEVTVDPEGKIVEGPKWESKG